MNGFSLRGCAIGLLAVLILGACTGGGSSGGSTTGSTSGGTGGGTTGSTSGGTSGSTTGGTTGGAALTVSAIELAQTHVLPAGGKSWTLSKASESLHFIGARGALALVELAQTDAASPILEGWLNGARVGMVALAAPIRIPPTEAGGAAYASDRYSTTIPAAWMSPGLQLRVTAGNYQPSALQAVAVGAGEPITVKVLPFYLYGADDSTQPLASVAQPDATTVREMFAKWPVAQLTVVNHPAQRANWPTLVIGPRADSGGVARAAYLAHSSDEQKDGFASMSAVLSVLGKLITANGEDPGPVQYYAPLIMRNAAGQYVSSGGGLAQVGGDVATGDISFAGIFIHELGHAFGLSHAGEAYDAGAFPYFWGSLDGSAWGYDPDHGEFLAPFVPTSASTFSHCMTDTFAGHARAIDAQNRCIKQDPMQSGAGDQDPSYRFDTFADFSAAVMQRHVEGTTTLDSGGAHVYSGGFIVQDASFPDGYKRWDGIDLKWVDFAPVTTNYGQYGFFQNLPIQRNVAVRSIALTISKAGTAGATQIYPTLAYTGNLVRTIDPNDASQRAEIDPSSGSAKWYCVNSGCDYTLRVSYSSGTVRTVLLQGGFRSFNDPAGAFPANVGNATDGSSFRTFAVNVPDDAPITKIELLDTPMAWTGLPAAPTVLASSLAPPMSVQPDHVVVVMMENHSYADIIGNAGAPYINSLAAGGASFSQSFAVTHPSQPNYLALFSGSTQGVTDDACPQTFASENLGHQLIAAGLGFAIYSEDLPGAGSTVCGSGNYARKHNPAVDFTNVPAAANLPFTSFPTDFTTLPTVAMVVPNLCNDMHDCSVATGDAWLQSHLDAYVQWAKAHNSLLILTWDEDDFSQSNQIPTVFSGARVVAGSYPEAITHYSLLRTIEDFYALGHAGSAATAAPITDIWH